MWYEGGCLKPRSTIIPRPSPTRPWQGEQEMLKRSCPRKSSARVSGTGRVATNIPSGPMAVWKTRWARSSPRATVPSTGGRAPDPSSKKSLSASGFTFGWLNMSWRQAATATHRARTAPARHARPAPASGLDIEHSARAEIGEKGPRRRLVELRVLGLDAQEVAVPARQREARNVEHRMVRRRQAVQGEHAEDGEDPRDQDGHLEGHRDERRPGVVRTAADVERIRDGRDPVLQPVPGQGPDDPS